jgi:tetratricopeptide (TPR) repeat protein
MNFRISNSTCTLTHLQCERPPAQLAANEAAAVYHNPKVDMTAIGIQSTAESLTLPKTAHWYTCVGWAILAKSPTDLPTTENQERAAIAIDYFEKAIEIDSGAWPAHAGLGQCHGAGLADFVKGIKHFQDAIRVMDNNVVLATMVSRFQSIIGSWSLHQPETAMQAAREAFNGMLHFPYPRDIQDRRLFNQTVRNYIQAMCEAKHYEDIEEFGTRLSIAKVEFYSKSVWACFLEDWRIDEIGASEDRMSVLLNSVSNAPNAAAMISLIQGGVSELDFPGYGLTFSPLTFMTTSQWIQWLYEHSAPSEDFLEMCRKFLHGYEDLQYTARDWHQIISFMAVTYLRRAITVHHSGLDTASDIAHLQELGQRKHHMRAHDEAYFAKSLYGLWRHEYCSPNDNEWKTYMRPAINEASTALINDDAFKRQSAYARLGESLLRAKDLENAHIALGLTLMPLHAYQLAKREQREIISVPKTSLFVGWCVMWNCDAPFGCETPSWEYEEVWFCRMCYNTNFCGECVKKVKDGDAEWKARCHCSKDHDLIKCYPLSEEAEKMVESLTKGETGEFDAWLAKVKAEWL